MMIQVEQNGVPFLQFPHLARFSALRHGVFTRRGGCSDPPFHSLNVGRETGDAEDRVRRNRARIAECMGGTEPVYLHQVHGTRVVSLPRKGEGRNSNGPNLKGDALVTDMPGRNLAIQVADCQAVLLYGADRKVVADVHSGWRGSIHNILGETVREMARRFDCAPAHIHAGIGPSLGPCCAEFIHYQREIPSRFWGYKDDRDHFDFWAVSRDQLRKAGVPAENILNSGLCTRCRTDLFFSYRGEAATGRFAAVIGLR
ncbi:MAG: peptidoglycan editing factor PgeF [Thermodesulfobacteriota bacterium]